MVDRFRRLLRPFGGTSSRSPRQRAAIALSFVLGTVALSGGIALLASGPAKAAMSPGCTVEPSTYVYDGLQHGLSVTCEADGVLQSGLKRNVPGGTVTWTFTPDDTETYSADSGSGTVTITARPITITANTDSKTYDGSASSSVAPTFSFGTLATGQTRSGCIQTFDSASADTGKTITASGCIIRNAALADVTSNYDIDYVDASGDITAVSLTASITASVTST